jgi:N-acetyl-alpha-D-muramate 1-phosphate uridylyltransferase
MRTAMVLAAGRGERMRPLTGNLPKPLLRAGGRMLIEWQIERLARAGFDDLVINHSHFGQLIEQALGDGSAYGVRIRYSRETEPLETAGGVVQALHLLGREPILVVSADIYTEFDYATLRPRMEKIAADPAKTCAHFVLVGNPPWHPEGDMALREGRVVREGDKLTYGNISIFHPAMFAGLVPGTWLKLFPWSYQFVEANRVSGERFSGEWDNVGTPAHLEALDRRLQP